MGTATINLDGYGLNKIKNELERRGIKTSMGKSRWYETVISHVLKNSFYCGIMTYHKQYTPDYLTQKKVNNYGELDFIYVEGTHEPIVTVEEFERVQKIMESKRTELPHVNRGRRSGKPPKKTIWGRLLICECGSHFNMRVWDRADGHLSYGYQCYSSVNSGSYESRKKRGLPLEGICRSPMVPEWRLQLMANLIFREYLRSKDKVLSLANSILESHITDTEENRNDAAELERMEKELDTLNKKMDRFIEMRSDGEISKELFMSKSAELQERIKTVQNEIQKLSIKTEVTVIENYDEKLTVLRYALEQYTNWDEDENIPESVIEAFVEKILVTKDEYVWYLRFDGENDPIRCKVEGKRKNNTKISIVASCSPTVRDCSTGCYQGTVIL